MKPKEDEIIAAETVKPKVKPSKEDGIIAAEIVKPKVKPREDEELGTQLGTEKAIGIEENLGRENKACAIGEALGAELGAAKVTGIEAALGGQNTGIGIGKEPGEAEEESRGPKNRKIEKEPSTKSPMGNTWRRTCGISNGGEGRQFREPLRRVQCA